MNIIDRIAERIGYASRTTQQAMVEEAVKAVAKKYPQWLLASAEAEKFTIPDGSMYRNQAELYQRLSWVHTAVSVTSSYAAVVPLNIKRKRGEKTKDIENHEFELLLQNPNPNQSRFEFLRATYAYILLCGNAYWWLNRTSETATPTEMWLISPSHIKPIPDGRLYIKGYEYDPGDGHTINLPPWQIVHFKDFHPNNQFAGLSKVEPLVTVAQTDLKQQDWMGKLYGQNNGRLPGLIAFADPITNTEWETIKRDIKEAGNSSNYMLLRNVGKGGVELLNAVSKISEMEYNTQRAFTKEEVYSVFAPGLASVLAINATEANARTGKATLVEFCIYPMQVAIAEKVTNKLMPLYATSQITLTAEFEDIRITDRAMELAEMGEYARVHTIDEIRAKFYEDDPLAQSTKVEADERGIMLPEQVSPTTPVPTDEELEPEPIPTNNPLIPTRPEQMPVDEEQPQEQPGEETGEAMTDGKDSQDVEDVARKAGMKAWRQFAIRRLKEGKSAGEPFTHKAIPAEMIDTMSARLHACKTADDVRAVFTEQEQEAEPPKPDFTAAILRTNALLEQLANVATA